MKREDLGDLTAFLMVAREQSFTRAAARLGTSQSALSHTIRRLEERLGIRLLTRTTRKVSVTDAGERLLARLVPAMSEIEAGLAELTEFKDKPAGTIRITTSEHAATTLIWPALETLLPDYPEVHVELSLNNGFVDIVADRFDAGVRLGESVAKDMIAVRIGPELRLAAVAAPAYFECNPAPKTPFDLSRHRCINIRQQSSGGLYSWEFEKDGREVRVRVDGQLTFNASPLIIKAAQAGLGMALIMEDIVAPMLADGSLLRVLEDWCPPFPGYHLYYPSRRQPSAAFALVLEALRNRG
ncbi:LysR family transcriptional regulator [Sphingopyxis witflariensis]|uniref:LysR family transcriptional regulator n=1 Tax=Sphingopyxis witflariensis TaxID=173675 RepID=A0A246JXZ4_9SPHN|nr:LysR family transcriptional regulator [Sphingopyxis witflariensis]OWQ97958.1 LysR family transcriptional regulator [Sphingopyxis witflariensis]